MCEVEVRLPFACGYPVFSDSFVEKTTVSPLNYLWHLLEKNQFIVNVRIYFWALNSSPSIYQSVFCFLLKFHESEEGIYKTILCI